MTPTNKSPSSNFGSRRVQLCFITLLVLAKPIYAFRARVPDPPADESKKEDGSAFAEMDEASSNVFDGEEENATSLAQMLKYQNPNLYKSVQPMKIGHINQMKNDKNMIDHIRIIIKQMQYMKNPQEPGYEGGMAIGEGMHDKTIQAMKAIELMIQNQTLKAVLQSKMMQLEEHLTVLKSKDFNQLEKHFKNDENCQDFANIIDTVIYRQFCYNAHDIDTINKQMATDPAFQQAKSLLLAAQEQKIQDQKLKDFVDTNQMDKNQMLRLIQDQKDLQRDIDNLNGCLKKPVSLENLETRLQKERAAKQIRQKIFQTVKSQQPNQRKFTVGQRAEAHHFNKGASVQQPGVSKQSKNIKKK